MKNFKQLKNHLEHPSDKSLTLQGTYTLLTLDLLTLHHQFLPWILPISDFCYLEIASHPQDKSLLFCIFNIII
jgi:hypothetical protein